MTNQPPPQLPGINEMLDTWRQTASEMEQRWNDYLNQVMGSDAFAQTMARSTEGFSGLQASFAQGMEQYLRALNLPTRADIAQLIERVGKLEQKIDALGEALALPEGEARPARRPRKKGKLASGPDG